MVTRPLVVAALSTGALSLFAVTEESGPVLWALGPGTGVHARDVITLLLGFVTLSALYRIWRVTAHPGRRDGEDRRPSRGCPSDQDPGQAGDAVIVEQRTPRGAVEARGPASELSERPAAPNA